MSNVTVLKAELRETLGKGASRDARRQGVVPAVVYGAGQDPVHITLDPLQLDRELHQTGFFSKIFEIPLGKNKERALARDVQFHPVKDNPLHVDFMRIAKDGKVTVSVPFSFINEDMAPGIKKGGLLNIVLHSLEVNCNVDSIPESIEVDLTGLNVHDTVHLTKIALPKGVVAAHADRDNDIANIVASTMMRGQSEETTEESAS